ncbi:NblA/ycf18 family protein [Nostoc sp.]|uniref:NblA/ycf18 family protein n=1 Tax=Nostoc sp. TaxID=1180 RepID=UPI002FF5AA56
MNQPIELSLEQEFSLRTFSDQVQQMSREQAQEFLLILYKQMIVREATYQEMLKHEWELDSGSILG